MFWKIVVRAATVWWLLLKYGLRWLFIRARRPEFTRRAFEELGPTYIKLGQLIASSPGLFPKPYSTEFQKCLDRVPPFGFDQVRLIIEEELQKPLDEAFGFVDDQPIAAASIAQVHGARLHDGTDVVVKVQRPHIREYVDADLWFMRRGARIAELFSLMARLANLRGVIEDFSVTLYEELDFTVEGRNMDEFNKIMVRHRCAEEIVAPVVHWDVTTRRLLTMERFYGFKVDDIDAAREHGLDTERWLRIGLRGWNLTMMLHGFFHGDVHAGNLLFLNDQQKLGFIDFGIVGRFDLKQRRQVMRYILSFATQDYDELATVMAQMGALKGEVDMPALVADMKRVYTPMLTQSLSELEYARFLPDIIANSRKHGIYLPREFILILKQLLYFDRYAKLAAPTLNGFTDPFLVDFLFTPDAVACGVDLAEVGKMLQAIQARVAAAKKTAAAKELPAGGGVDPVPDLGRDVG